MLHNQCIRDGFLYIYNNVKQKFTITKDKSLKLK
jgi:hypothetical protein